MNESLVNDADFNLHYIHYRHPLCGLMDSFREDKVLSKNIILLYSAIFQEWRYSEIIRFLEVMLSQRTKFWSLPMIYQSDIQDFLMESKIPRFYQINSKIPGIVWSVSEFIRKNPLWSKDLLGRGGHSMFTDNIFFFGKNSKSKPKLRRLHATLLYFFPNEYSFNSSMIFPLSYSSIEFFKNNKVHSEAFFQSEGVSRMDYYTKYCNSINSRNPELVYGAVEALNA